MSEVVWQLPVRQSNKTDHDWIHPKAKYHAFVNNKSMCGKYVQDTSFFDNIVEEDNLKNVKQYICQQCIKRRGIDITTG